MEGFQDEQKDIENYIVKDGYTKLNNFKENWSDFLYVISKDNKKFIGKLYESKKFLEIYRVFIIEFNMESFFIIPPIEILQNVDDYFYFITEEYCNIYLMFPERKKTKKKVQNSKELTKNKNLNTLLIITTLINAIQSLHIQKNPIIHRYLKPDKILFDIYEIKEGKLIELTQFKNNFSLDKFNSEMIFLTKLSGFDFIRRNSAITKDYILYRTGAFYLETSDLLSIAMIILRFLTDFQQKNNICIIEHSLQCIKKLYFKNKEKINGLEKIVQMFLDAYDMRKSNIFDVMDILTDEKKFKQIFSDDFMDQNQIDKYFQVLKMINIKIEYEEEFDKIAPTIYGVNYKPFLFTLFHQANNEFNQDFFSKYQKTIIKIYKEKQNQGLNEIIDEITEYHCHINFFCFQDKFEQLTNEMSLNNKISTKSKLFKILTSLDFNDTRSLNHFAKALSYSLSSIDSGIERILLYNFGKDYQSKIGFFLFHSTLSNEECFKLILRMAKYYYGSLIGYGDYISKGYSDYQEIKYDFDDFDVSDDLVYIDDFDFFDELKLDFIFKLQSYETITSSFSEFLQLIHYDGKLETEQECIEKYKEVISLNNIQKSMIDKLTKLYGQDAKIIIFIHYLYYYEYNDEKFRIISLISGSIGNNKDNDYISDDDNNPSDDDDDDTSDDDDDDNTSDDDDNTSDDDQMLYDQNKKIQDKEIVAFYNIKYEKFYTFEDNDKLDIFNWMILFRMENLIESILSDDTKMKIEKYLPTIKFLKKLNINIFEFHIFMSNLISKNKYKQFEEMVHTFNKNQKLRYNKTEFLESIRFISQDFYDIIISKQGKIKIFIEIKNEKLLSIKINPLYTIKYLKCEIEKIYKIPDDQSLCFVNKKLKNDITIYDYGIKHGSTIHFVDILFEIFIEIGTNKLLPITINNIYIRELKDIIKKICGFKTFSPPLFYEEKELDDLKKIDFYEIDNGSTIKIFEKNPSYIDIFIQIQNNEQIELILNKTTTIESLKKTIYNKFQIPIESQVLSFNDKVLNNENNLQNSSLVDFSKIDLTVFPIEMEEIHVNYKSIHGQDGRVTIDPKEKVESIILKICEKENIEKNQYKLIYNDKLLNNSDIIRDCLIFEGSTLILTLSY